MKKPSTSSQNPGWLRADQLGAHLSINTYGGNGTQSTGQESLYAAETKRVADQLRLQLAMNNAGLTTLIGPVPCFFSRLAGHYRWQVILRGPEPELLLAGMKMAGWRVEVDPISLL